MDADTTRETLLANLAVNDANGDGQLSYGEAVAAVPCLDRETFDALDTDENGLLSQAELPPTPSVGGI